MNLTLSLSGANRIQALQRRLLEFGKEQLSAAAYALRGEAEIEMTEAKRRTPVRTSALKNSGMVTGPEGEDWSVRMAFGGPSAPYAIYVHENEEAFHAVGQAKFLESVLLESAPYLAERVARRMRGGG